MNFKTTVVLIVLLFAAGLTLYLTKDKGGGSDTTSEKADKKAQKVFDLAEDDITKLAITSAAEGKKLTLEKVDGKWRLTEPVAAPGDSFGVDSLVRSVASLESHGEAGGSADAKAMGLDNPRYTIDLTAKDGKSYTLLVGDKLPVGDNLYVSRKDKGNKLVVSADLLEKLEKPASDYRDKKLVNDFSTAGITQVTLNKPDGMIVISRANAGDDWKIIEPAPAMPAERADIDSIVTALTDLRATEFVSDDPTQAKMYQLDPPRMSAVLSSAPATQPASTKPTSQPAPIVIKFGRYDDVLKSNVFAMTSQSPAIAKVAASSLESINKKPLDLRDKRAADIDPAQVVSVQVVTDTAATTKPTSRPASKTDVTISHHVEPPVLVLAPTTKATTGPATTQATAATKPVAKWDVAVGNPATTKPAAADDTKVDALLSSLHPLRVRKYLEKAPATQPSVTYKVKLVAQAAGGAAPVNYEITLVDPGNGGDVSGTYNGLAFEVDRFFLDHLTGDFLKGSKPAVSPGAMPGGLPPGAFPGANEGPTNPVGP